MRKITFLTLGGNTGIAVDAGDYMVRKKYIEEQIIALLKEAEAGQSYRTSVVSAG